MTRSSTLRRAAALVAIPATIAAFAAPAAWAQDATLSVTASENTCGRTTLTATAPAGVYEIAVYSGPNAGGAASDPIGQFSTSPDGPVSHTFTLPEDAYDGSGFVSWATISGPEQNAYVHGAIGVATDCAPAVEEEDNADVEDDEQADEQNDEDARTDDDLDCADFPLADGRTAQQVLDADPSDPHRLDADGDGAACEVDEDENVDDTTPDGTNNDGTQPGGDVTNGGDADTDAANGGNATAGDASGEANGVYYENCAAARDAGVTPLYATDDGYRDGLDSDGDGIACEGGTLYNGSGDFSQTGEVPVGSAETGAA